MKTKRYFLASTVVAMVLCVSAVAIENEHLLLDHSLLAGIGQLQVVIIRPATEPNIDSLFWDELEGQVRDKLTKAGIKIYPPLISTTVIPADAPELRVMADMVRLANCQQCVFHTRTLLAAKVLLEGKPKFSVKADIWRINSPIQAVPAENMRTAVTQEVLGQVEAFIISYLSANPQSGRRPDSNDTNNVSLTAKTVQTEPNTKPAAAEYKYVASKNRPTFHKPDCRWTKKISPENLVGYKTREDAINAGKKPCKQCKP